MKKEQEWIVNPEELRKNRERALLRDELKKQKKEDKKTIITIIILCIITILIIGRLLIITGNNAVEHCVKSGNSVEFCNANLRG